MDSRATRFPEGFELDWEMIGYAQKFHLIPRPTFEHFKDHHLAKGSRFVDWRAAFRTWCRRAQQYSGRIEPVSVEGAHQHTKACFSKRITEAGNVQEYMTCGLVAGTPETRYCATCGHTGSWHKNEVKHNRPPNHEFVSASDTQDVAQCPGSIAQGRL